MATPSSAIAFGAVFEPVADTRLTMAATDQTPDPNKALAPREPSIHGPSDNGNHASVTDPDARLYKKAPGAVAMLCFMGHTLME